MTRDEFIKGYCERSGMTWEELSKDNVALPCACGDETCKGWAMVRNDSSCIQTHNQLYAPPSQNSEEKP